MNSGEIIKNETQDSNISGKIKRAANGCQFKKDALPSCNTHGGKPRKNRIKKCQEQTTVQVDRKTLDASCKQLHEGVEERVMQTTSKTGRIKECIQQSVSEESKQKIALILDEVLQLSDVEKLLLYLQLPTGGRPEVDPLKSKVPGNPLGKKADAEVAQTYTWIKSHLEEDHEVSLPKQEVYEEYKMFCEENKIEPLCAADFGKVMKHVFPSVKPRRLGTRGNSRYCYSGLRKKLLVESPTLPDLDISDENTQSKTSQDEEIVSAASHLIFEWAEKLLGKRFATLKELSSHLVENLYVDTRSVAAFTILSSSHQASSKGHHAASLLKSAGGNRRRETQLHLQRKLQEKELIKEQKKKLLEQRSLLSPRKSSSRGSKAKKEQESNLQRQDSAEPTLTEQQQTQEPPKSSEEKPPPPVESLSPEEEELARVRSKKVMIPRNRSAVHFPQTSIIILPSIPPRVQLKSKSHKYKRIQPKPSCASPPDPTSLSRFAPRSVQRTRSEETVGNESCERSEKSSPVPDVPKDDSELQGGLPRSKRPSEDVSVSGVTKRLHFENAASSGNTTSSGSLSPWSRTEASSSGGHEHKEEVSVRQLETDALLEYLQESETTEKTENTAQLSQLRLLLERNLPQRGMKSSTQGSAGSVAEESGGCYSELRQALMRDNRTCFRSKSEPEKSSLVLDWNEEENHQSGLLLKEMSQLESAIQQEFPEYATNPLEANLQQALESSLLPDPGCLTGDAVNLPVPQMDAHVQASYDQEGGHFLTNFQKHHDEVTCNSAYTQIPSVPPSPNTRRRAFNFLPISPRQTPVPENFNYSASPVPSQTCANTLANSLVSIAVGPSQPPSTATSPFMSPRSTPVPVSRSRHNSGQSCYSTPRQTPCQNFDSGVSSISTSPFVSPQSTPVPVSRLRHNSSHSQGKTVTFCTTQSFARARRNSGPGGPPPIPSQFTPRSAPLSPLVGECYLQAFTFPVVAETGMRSRHNSASTPPVSGPASPKPQSDPVIETIPVQEDTSRLWSRTCKLPSMKSSWNQLWPVRRSRHASGSVIHPRQMSNTLDPLAQEIQSLLQDGVISQGATNAASRSRSVPLHQMLLDQCGGNFSEEYPPPPLADECKFQLPSVPTGDPSAVWGTSMPRRNLAELLEQPPPLEDDLQTTLEDLRDVDTDFSQLARQLEEMDGDFA